MKTKFKSFYLCISQNIFYRVFGKNKHVLYTKINKEKHNLIVQELAVGRSFIPEEHGMYPFISKFTAILKVRRDIGHKIILDRNSADPEVPPNVRLLQWSMVLSKQYNSFLFHLLAVV